MKLGQFATTRAQIKAGRPHASAGPPVITAAQPKKVLSHVAHDQASK